MTPNRVLVAMEKYGKCIPGYCYSAFRKYLEEADDNCMDEFMFLRVKSKWLTLAFSILLGGIAVDRFYIGDTGTGVAKLIVRLSGVLLNALGVPVIGVILNVISSIWCIADIFVTFKRVKELNYAILSSFLRRHKAETK